MFKFELLWRYKCSKIIVSEYDQEIPQSQITDKPMAQRGRAIVVMDDFLGTGIFKPEKN